MLVKSKLTPFRSVRGGKLQGCNFLVQSQNWKRRSDKFLEANHITFSQPDFFPYFDPAESEYPGWELEKLTGSEIFKMAPKMATEPKIRNLFNQANFYRRNAFKVSIYMFFQIRNPKIQFLKRLLKPFQDGGQIWPNLEIGVLNLPFDVKTC